MLTHALYGHDRGAALCSESLNPSRCFPSPSIFEFHIRYFHVIPQEHKLTGNQVDTRPPAHICDKRPRRGRPHPQSRVCAPHFPATPCAIRNS
jgi:hypothetical protein